MGATLTFCLKVCYDGPLMNTPMHLRLGHSPDPDDAFMFYALAYGKIPTEGLTFEHILKDIETLNSWAMEGKLEITALSLHAYSYVADKYVLLPQGASMGDRYGPIIVMKETVESASPLALLKGARIAIPGLLTTANLLLHLYLSDFEGVIVPFDQIMDEVKSGKVDAGLLIHEGQLTHGEEGLHKIVDLGEWWHEQTGLPLPFGINAVRRDLGDPLMKKIARILKESIEYGLAHREPALNYAMQYGRGMPRDLADRFVEMYVNHRTMALGEEGMKGIYALLEMGWKKGVLKQQIIPEFVSLK